MKTAFYNNNLVFFYILISVLLKRMSHVLTQTVDFRCCIISAFCFLSSYPGFNLSFFPNCFFPPLYASVRPCHDYLC